MIEAQNIEHIGMSFKGHHPEEDMDFESGTNPQSFQQFAVLSAIWPLQI